MYMYMATSMFHVIKVFNLHENMKTHVSMYMGFFPISHYIMVAERIRNGLWHTK